MNVNENKEDKSTILAKEAKSILSWLHTINIKNNKHQENDKFANRNGHIQVIEYMQHKNATMSWIIGCFLGTQVMHKGLKEWEGILLFHIIITWYTQISVNVFVVFVIFHVHIYPVFINLINIGLPSCAPSYQLGYARFDNFYFKKYFNITMIGSSWNY